MCFYFHKRKMYFFFSNISDGFTYIWFLFRSFKMDEPFVTNTKNKL